MADSGSSFDDRIPETDQAAHEAAQADRLVGRAVGVSVAALVLVGVVALGAWWFSRPREAPAPVVGPVAGPAAAQGAPEGAIVPIPFSDMGLRWGIEFSRENGAAGDKLLPETLGGGVAIADFDGDGLNDLLFVNGEPWGDPGPLPPTAHVYASLGSGEFVDVTNRSGLDVPLQGMGVAVADYDGDGRRDVLITTVGQDRLFRNVTESPRAIRFEDVTEKALPKENAWGTSAGFLDYDRDGDLDLFVCNYVEWSPDIDKRVGYSLTGIGRAYGPPDGFAGVDCFLWRNEGDGTFADVTEKAGVAVRNPATGAPVCKALGTTFVDVDRDGWIDIAVANDKVGKCLWRNRGDGTFEEIGAESGFAYSREGGATGAMGIDSSWFRGADEGNERLAFAIGNFANEMSALYVADAPEGGAKGSHPIRFADDAIPEGIGPATRRVLTFGSLFFDADLDGYDDLLQTNGHLEDQINRVYPNQDYLQPAQLFRNATGSAPDRPAFWELPRERTRDLGIPIVGRGAAYGDLDGDGDLDLVMTQPRGNPLILRNDREPGNHWLRVRLVGGPMNRDAIGAEVEVTAGGRTQRKQVMPTRSYLSQCEPELTFGLGKADRIEKLVVRWPDGTVEDRTAEVAGVDGVVEVSAGSSET